MSAHGDVQWLCVVGGRDSDSNGSRSAPDDGPARLKTDTRATPHSALN
jgi:hypothetical protein